MDLSGVSRKVVAPVRSDPAGIHGPTRHQAAGNRWRRVGAGLYVPSDCDLTTDQRIVEAAASLPADGAVTGWAALHWLGAPWFPGTDPSGDPLPVPLAIGDRHPRRRVPGAMLAQRWFDPDAVVRIDGLPITVPAWSVSHEMRHPRRRYGGVIALDMAAFSDLVSLEEMTHHLYVDLVGRPGVRSARRALALAHENSWSPQETVSRVEWLSARPAATLMVNVAVFDPRGRHLFTLDLLDITTGVAVEFDGLFHLDDGHRVRGLQREESIRSHHIELVTRMTGPTHSNADFLARLRSAYSRAARHRGEDRTWTVEQPDWWVDTSTVHQRRALGSDEREIWLKHRS
ncbi:hypothetical protein BH09ACT11_BH09ACT11_17830 [soil metagenome]